MQTEIKNDDGMYTTKGGNVLTSKEYAEALNEAIEHYNNQIQTTKDKRKIKKLQDRLRSIKIFLSQHDDVKKFIK